MKLTTNEMTEHERYVFIFVLQTSEKRKQACEPANKNNARNETILIHYLLKFCIINNENIVNNILRTDLFKKRRKIQFNPTILKKS